MTTIPLVLALVLGAEPQEQSIRLSPGSQQVVQVQGLVRVALADPTIADVTVTGPNELLLLGHKQGKTTLTLWAKGKKQPSTRLVVVDDGKFADLAQLVKDKVNPTLKAEVYAEKLVIDGIVDSVEEWGRLRQLVGDNPEVKLLVKLNPRALPVLAEQINAELRKAGLASAKAVVMGGRLVLEGSVADPGEKQKAGMIAQAFYWDFASGL